MRWAKEAKEAKRVRNRMKKVSLTSDWEYLGYQDAGEIIEENEQDTNYTS
jgi:hypothetical protein